MLSINRGSFGSQNKSQSMTIKLNVLLAYHCNDGKKSKSTQMIFFPTVNIPPQECSTNQVAFLFHQLNDVGN